MTYFRTLLAAVLLIILPAMLNAQTQVPFGGLKHDSNLPVEITADNLEISQADGSSVFSGNVIIAQGDMRLSASRVQVQYSQEGDERRISLLRASGGVILINGEEAAEAAEALYSIDNSSIVMTGDVILTQGASALSANSMTVDMKSGKATLAGRVKTILQTGKN